MFSNITLLKNHRFTISSFFFGKLATFSSGLHSHAHFELYYVVSGKVKFTCADKDGLTKTESLKSNDIVLIDCAIEHSITFEKESDIICVEFCAAHCDSDAAPYIDCFETLCHCTALLTAFDKSTYIYLNDFMFIKQSLLRLQALVNSARLRYADNYFTQLILSEILLSVDECYSKPYLVNPHINLILEHIARNFDEDISVKSIAKAVNLNPSYMQKLFKREVGSTIFEHITQLKVNKSIMLMRNTNLTFSAISDEVGFNNRQSFFNAFKNVTGYPPKLFRKYLASPTGTFIKK